MLNVVITLLLAKESKTAHEISLQLRCTKQTLPGPYGSLFKNDGQSCSVLDKILDIMLDFAPESEL